MILDVNSVKIQNNSIIIVIIIWMENEVLYLLGNNCEKLKFRTNYIPNFTGTFY